MKIYIVGAVASGKSTLAIQLSELIGVPYYALDEVVHIPDAYIHKQKIITDYFMNRNENKAFLKMQGLLIVYGRK